MYKTDRNYKMTYQSKRLLARILDPHYRGEVKRLMIQSEALASVKAKTRSGKGSFNSSSGARDSETD